MRGIAYFNLLLNYQQTYAIAKDKRGVILRLSSEDPDSMPFSTVEQGYQQVSRILKKQNLCWLLLNVLKNGV